MFVVSYMGKRVLGGFVLPAERFLLLLLFSDVGATACWTGVDIAVVRRVVNEGGSQVSWGDLGAKYSSL